MTMVHRRIENVRSLGLSQATESTISVLLTLAEFIARRIGGRNFMTALMAVDVKPSMED